MRVMGIAFLLIVGVVAPAAAAPGPTRLFDASVTPRTGTTATQIELDVSYRNREGSPADYVRVRIGGSTHAMVKSGGTDWKREVRFSWAGTLPAGTHAIQFQAMSRDRFDDALDAGSVTITTPATPRSTAEPTESPTPTPKPTARPTASPKPTAAPAVSAMPTAAPTGSPTSTGPNPTSSGAPNESPPPNAAPMSPGSPSVSPSGSGVPGSRPSSAPSPSTVAVAVPAGAPGSAGGSGGPSDAGAPGGPGAPVAPRGAGSPGGANRAGGSGGSGGGDGGAFAALAAAVGTIGFSRPSLPLGLVMTMTTTTGLVGAAVAFSVFGKRRRDGEPPAPDEVLAEAAASGLAVAASALVARPGSGPSDAEAAMPRWRRPSLLEARKADPVRDAVVTQRLSFDHGLVGPLDGRERRLIRYTVVRLLDQPDELRGAEIGFLDSGDEVQLLEKRGVYWLILCPDGRQGWIHKMTLGDVVDDARPAGAPTATMPIDADTWTMGEDVDGDVLAAYLESRRRT